CPRPCPLRRHPRGLRLRPHPPRPGRSARRSGPPRRPHRPPRRRSGADPDPAPGRGPDDHPPRPGALRPRPAGDDPGRLRGTEAERTALSRGPRHLGPYRAPMVQPTLFDRLMQEASKQAATDPVGAFGRLDELFGKSTTAEDVLKLGAFAVHLGCAGLDRAAEAETFQRRLLQHPAVADNDFVRRSLLRGLVVAMRLQGKGEEATSAMAQGVTSTAERARLAMLTAQTFAARGRFADAAAYLSEAEPLLVGLDSGEDIVAQAAQ